MDLDRFLAGNVRHWDRLDDLLRRAGPRTRNLSSAEVDELIRLYQLTSAHLSYATTNFKEPGLLARLSQLVSRAGSLIYGTRARTLRALWQFVTETVPAAIWYSRLFVLASAALLLLPAVAVGVWLSNSSSAVDASAPAAVREAYINHDFAAYYRSAPAAQFASSVYTHNAELAILAFTAGILLCLPAIYVLVVNGANLGIAAGLFTYSGHTAEFWGLVLPHGLLELTSVTIAGAAGLRLGWTVIDPGDRSRRAAVAEEGRRAVVMLIATVFTLAVAGSIEGFVTGSSLPTAARVGIGVVVEVAFVAYVVSLGPRAVRAGASGALRG